MEDALFDSLAVQHFVGLATRGLRPDETTILNVRHLLEQHALGEALMAEITRHRAAQGVRLREGTIVDATIIDATTSTKNRAQARDAAFDGSDFMVRRAQSSMVGCRPRRGRE